MGRRRSNSLTSLLSARRRAGELQRQRRRGRPSLLSIHGLQLVCVVACALLAVIFGLCPRLLGFGALEAGGGDGVVQSTFTESIRKLHAIQVGADGEVPALYFLDAVDELQPAFKVMGLMFELATKEVTTNTRKLREAYHQHLNAAASASSVGGGHSSNSSPFSGGGGGGSSAHGTVSLQDLVWGPAGRPGRGGGAMEGTEGSGGGILAAVDDGGGGGGGASGGAGGSVVASSSHWLPVPQPVATYDALLWLGFGLHFMETLYGCIGDPVEGDKPALCAKRAYDVALRGHQNHYMRAIAGSLLNIVPISKEALVARTGMEHHELAPLLSTWAAAVRPHRTAIAAFYAKHWPPHTA